MLAFVLLSLLSGCLDDRSIYEPEPEGQPLALDPQAAVTLGSTTYLGHLGGGQSQGEDVNNLGQVAGYSVRWDGTTHAFLWTRDFGMVDLGTLGGNHSLAYAVNDHGQVVGRSGTPGNIASHAVRWVPGWGIQDLGTLGGTNSSGLATNDAGQVVGFSQVAGNTATRPFLWTSGEGMIDLGTLGGTYGEALGMSDAAHVAGYSLLSDGLTYHAFLWTPESGMQDLGTLRASGGLSFAFDVNSSGQVVGHSDSPAGTGHAFLWTAESGMVDLGLVPGCSASQAFGINEAGVVVGRLDCGSAQRVFVWTEAGGMRDIGAPGSANAVNDELQIAGWSTAMGLRATVWTYIPNQPPVASTDGPYSGAALSAIAFDAAASADPESDPLTYLWDFGDGTTSTAISPSKTYANHGSYTVQLTVTDDSEASSTVSTTAAVTNAKPSATFVVPAVRYEGQGYRLELRDAVDSPIDLMGLKHSFDCGSGAYGPFRARSFQDCPVVADQALLVVRGRIRDPQGARRSYLAELEVRNRPPSVRVVASTVDPAVGSNVSLDWTLNDAGVNDAPWRYVINWGDGTTTRDSTSLRGIRRSNHTYAVAGSHTVRIRVTDKDGGSRLSAPHVVVVSAGSI